MAYFDEAQNKIDKEEYYRELNEQGEKDFSLRLSALLQKTHTTRLHYKPALQLYPVVDRQESGKLFSIYSGKEYDLSQLLIMDAKAEIR